MINNYCTDFLDNSIYIKDVDDDLYNSDILDSIYAVKMSVLTTSIDETKDGVTESNMKLVTKLSEKYRQQCEPNNNLTVDEDKFYKHNVLLNILKYPKKSTIKHNITGYHSVSLNNSELPIKIESIDNNNIGSDLIVFYYKNIKVFKKSVKQVIVSKYVYIKYMNYFINLDYLLDFAYKNIHIYDYLFKNTEDVDEWKNTFIDKLVNSDRRVIIEDINDILSVIQHCSELLLS